jgi:hypothetical protein
MFSLAPHLSPGALAFALSKFYSKNPISLSSSSPTSHPPPLNNPPALSTPPTPISSLFPRDTTDISHPETKGNSKSGSERCVLGSTTVGNVNDEIRERGMGLVISEEGEKGGSFGVLE